MIVTKYRSVVQLSEINTAGAEASEEKLKGYAHMHRASYGGSAAARCPRRCLVAEVDMLDEHDLTVIILDDVVAVEPIAVLIEIVGALNARVVLDAQDRLADLLRLKTLSVVDRERQNMNSVVGPCPMEIGGRLVGCLVFRSELLGCRA